MRGGRLAREAALQKSGTEHGGPGLLQAPPSLHVIRVANPCAGRFRWSSGRRETGQQEAQWGHGWDVLRSSKSPQSQYVGSPSRPASFGYHSP